MTSLSMKAVCAEKSNWGTPETALAFSAADADIPDGATTRPYISISVNVDPEVASRFEKGRPYTLTFTPSED